MIFVTGSQRRNTRSDKQQREPAHMFTTYEFLATWLRARFGDDERGASLVEYALLVALIAVVCIAAVTLLGKNASSKFNDVGTSIN
jgi:pilus assembly protein Flp/PilA